MLFCGAAASIRHWSFVPEQPPEALLPLQRTQRPLGASQIGRAVS
jgi:hypothetical protein